MLAICTIREFGELFKESSQSRKILEQEPGVEIRPSISPD